VGDHGSLEEVRFRMAKKKAAKKKKK